MKVSYIRVSTAEQNEARQMEAMKDKGIEKYYIEKVSAKDTNRPKLQEMLEYVREGDIVFIHDFSRLARSTKDLLDIVEKLNKKGVTLKSNKENLDTSTPTRKAYANNDRSYKRIWKTKPTWKTTRGHCNSKERGKIQRRTSKKNKWRRV